MTGNKTRPTTRRALASRRTAGLLGGPPALWIGLVCLIGLTGCPEDSPDDGLPTDTGMAEQTQCTDGIDNDGDGRIDGSDPGCANAQDDDEADDPAPVQCANGVDDDGDEAIDYPADPGCASADDDDESDDPAPPACADGIDNDGDELIDFPSDPGCASAFDNNEEDPPARACADGIDNDDDGFIDYPADPGCGSLDDDNETDGGGGPIRPQCANGLDDDNDGRVDLADPGCSSVADPREAEGPDFETPQCSNGIDDDRDNIIDFPYDPGCSAAGDDDETDNGVPVCGNGADDDGDGEADFPHDPGCAGVGDGDETDPVITPLCSDGIDNDNDGFTDYPDDRGCESAADTSEGGACGRTYQAVEVVPGRIVRGDSRQAPFEAEGSCGGRGGPEVVFVYRVERPIEALRIHTDVEGNQLESAIYVRRGCLDAASEVACVREPVNDGVAANELLLPAPRAGEYYIFLDAAAGRGGPFALLIEEVPLAQCLNGEDDDGDGLADYPNDPGCSRADDRDETDPPEPPQCADDEDNDGDGEVDFPLDVGCQSAADNDEVDLCGQGLRTLLYPLGAPFVIDSTEGGTTQFTGSCEASAGPERIFVYENPINARLRLSVDFDETIARTTLYVRTNCTGAGSEVGCDTGEGAELKGSVQIDRAPPGTYYVFVDHPFGLGGRVKLAIDVERLPPGCSDLIDNDADGFTDSDDVGCASPDDEDERDPGPGVRPPACFDRVDNDDDGLIDYPYDPGCSGKGDEDEADPAVAPECANGLDDDEDGLTDFPADPGCSAAGDNVELGDRRSPQCTNRIDDDMDGLVDYPVDPGCAAPGDLSEADDDMPPACADDNDNDRDGLIDFPFDPGCRAAGFNSEVDPEVPYACSNGIDDDGDGVTDFPFEPGCQSAADDDETNAAFPPACANNIDDDGDGLTDFPNDRGCRFRGDTNETDPFNPPSRCENSIDDDADGLIDLRDPGCQNRDDDDEADPADAPECGNNIDDDEDGLIDWPDDIGCQARGDSPESQGCRDGVVVEDIDIGGAVRAATVDGGADNYRNICGGREAPDRVYRLIVDEPGDLMISADNPGTDYPVVLAVSRDCEEPRSLLSCAGDFRRPDPTVFLANAEPGEYYIFIDGGGPERWVGSDGPINLPADPRQFRASNDLNNDCWSDGGNDAFDCYGRTQVTFGGASTVLVVSPGQRQGAAGAYAFNYNSELVGNVWRLRMTPSEPNDERLVTITVTGNLGSDGGTQAQQPQIQFQGRQFAYLYTTDGGQFDPPVTHLLLPGDPDQLGNVTYANAGDNVTITARDITLPATFYVALSYADRAQVIQAVLNDIVIEAGGGGADAPRAGNFELTVDAE